MIDDCSYKFLVMLFGVKNAPATFQYLMYLVLGDYYHKFVFVYLNDIIIFSKTLEKHIQHVRLVFQALRKADLKIKPSKCQGFQTSLKYLGYTINRNGISTDPTNIAKLQQTFSPRNLK